MGRWFIVGSGQWLRRSGTVTGLGCDDWTVIASENPHGDGCDRLVAVCIDHHGVERVGRAFTNAKRLQFGPWYVDHGRDR